MKLDNRWVIADGTLNELPITIHTREDWQKTAKSGRFHICVQIGRLTLAMKAMLTQAFKRCSR